MSTAAIIVQGHFPVFAEVAGALWDSLEALGYTTGICTLEQWHKCDKKSRAAKVNVYLNGLGVTKTELDPFATNICIQTEQLEYKPKRLKAGYDTKDWHKVLDLFPEQQGKNVVFFPLGYSRHFDYADGGPTVDGDLFFFGKLTPYRRAFCKGHGVPAEVVWGKERDERIVRSLNVYTPPIPQPCFFARHHWLMVACKGKLCLYETPHGSQEPYRGWLPTFNRGNFKVAVEHIRSLGAQVGLKQRNWLMEYHKFEDNFNKCVEGVL